MEEIKMKDSGIKWIGQIPEDWDVKRLKYCVDKFGGGGTPESSNDEFYDDEHGVNWVAIGDMSTKEYVEETDRKVTELGIKDKQLTIYPKGTIIYSIYATIGKVSELKVPATINQALLAIIENKKILNKNYLKKYLNFLENIVLADTSTNTQANLNLQKVQNFTICLPFLIEQQKIAAFLDKKCADIDEIISKTEKQIETLEQYKKSLITETIITGNNPNAKLIKTNIKWIDKVSTEATILRLKNYSYMKGRIGWQGLTADEFIDEGPYCVTGTDFKNGYIDWNTSYHISEKRYQMDYNIQLKVGDLLVTKDGTIGKLARVNYLPAKACLNSHLLIIRPLRNKFINDYLYYVMSSDIFVKYYSFESNGSTMDSLSQEKLGRFTFPAYSIEKQKEIANYLDKKCADIDEVLNKQKESVETLKKYKQSLIYEYVTGKKRV